MGGFGGGDHFLVGRVGLAHANVLAHACVSKPRVLQDHAPIRAQRGAGNFSHVGAADLDRAVANVVEAHQKIDHRGLATAGRPYDRNALSLFDRQIQVTDQLRAIKLAIYPVGIHSK